MDSTCARPNHASGLQRYPDKRSDHMLDDEKQELMGEEIAKCKGIYVL